MDIVIGFFPEGTAYTSGVDSSTEVPVYDYLECQGKFNLFNLFN